jgi:hypothetical protein
MSRPIHLAIFAGSIQNSKTVSGRAAIRISRWIASSAMPLLRFGGIAKLRGPVVPERLEPRPELGGSGRSRPVEAPRAGPPFRQEAGGSQDTQVLGDCGTRHVEASGDLARGQLAIANERQDGPAPGIGERLQGRFHCLAG